ncbi:MAG: hypothetical protein IPJ62_06835 [Betaproteobacteria bacterium]|nr:hypothetical protein [Betaproteobacteria bacterium]
MAADEDPQEQPRVAALDDRLVAFVGAKLGLGGDLRHGLAVEALEQRHFRQQQVREFGLGHRGSS